MKTVKKCLIKVAVWLFVRITSFSSTGKAKRNIGLIRPDLSRKAIQKGLEELRRIKTENYFALAMVNSLNIEEMANRELRVISLNNGFEQMLELYRKSNEGFIVLSSHTGFSEKALMLFPARLDKELHQVSWRAFILVEDIPFLGFLTNKLRGATTKNLKFQLVKRGKAVKALRERLAAGDSAMIGFDQVGRRKRGVECRIGENAKAVFQAGWAVVAIETGAPIVLLRPDIGEDSQTMVTVLGVIYPEKTERADESFNSKVEVLVRRAVALYEPFFLENCFRWTQITSIDLFPTGKGPIDFEPERKSH